MITVTRKICLIGDFGVGKTSLVQQFVNQAFAESYQTTVGVTIETKQIQMADGTGMKMIIWDIAGSDSIDWATRRYLRGSNGFFLVVDGTRARTLESAVDLRKKTLEVIGKVPHVCLFNKSDLRDAWELDTPLVEKLKNASTDAFNTSAKTGDNVEDAFAVLGEAMSR
jgi:small GTP-binding protein